MQTQQTPSTLRYDLQDFMTRVDTLPVQTIDFFGKPIRAFLDEHQDIWFSISDLAFHLGIDETFHREFASDFLCNMPRSYQLFSLSDPEVAKANFFVRCGCIWAWVYSRESDDYLIDDSYKWVQTFKERSGEIGPGIEGFMQFTRQLQEVTP